MRLTLAVIGLAAAAVAQEFVPIGGGSGLSRPRITPDFGRIENEFGEVVMPNVINTNDPAFQPVNIAGNRPNPIPAFPKSQLAGTPHEAPVDFTFVHQHSYKEPFRTDQSVPSIFNRIGAARPNIPRTLGREDIYIDPRADPNSALSRAEAEKKTKNMVFYGLAPPVEKLHNANEFGPSTIPLQNPWDAWYDRFETSTADPRKQFLLTQTKRPKIVDIPFYGADRGKREAEIPAAPILDSDIITSTTTFAPLSDVIGTTSALPVLEAATAATLDVVESTSIADTSSDDAAQVIFSIETTTKPANATGGDAIVRIQTTTATTSAPVVAAGAPGAQPTEATTVAPVVSTTTAAALTPVNLTAPGGTAATPALSTLLNGEVVTAPTAKRLLDAVNQTATDPSVPSTGPSIAFRPKGRRPHTTLQPASVVQKLRTINTKVPLRTTVALGETTIAPITKSTKKALTTIKLDNAVGSARNASRSTTRLPLRNTTLVKRMRVSLRRLLNTTLPTAAPTTSLTSTKSLSTGTTAAASSSKASTVTPTPSRTTAINTLKALQRANTTTTARTKSPFRIFSKRPLATSKLPARTPIAEEVKSSPIDSNNLGTLRTEVNRLLTTVVQLQSTVIAQQQRIALLENQLRLRRAAKPASNKTTRFVTPDGRTVERTIMDIRKGRAIRARNVVSQSNLRQRSSLA